MLVTGNKMELKDIISKHVHKYVHMLFQVLTIKMPRNRRNFAFVYFWIFCFPESELCKELQRYLPSHNADKHPITVNICRVPSKRAACSLLSGEKAVLSAKGKKQHYLLSEEKMSNHLSTYI